MTLRLRRPPFASCALSEKAITNFGIFGEPGTSSYDDRFPATDVFSPVVAVGYSDHFLITVHSFPSEPKASSADADLAATVAVGAVHAVRDGDHAASTFFKASDFLSYISSPNIVARLVFAAAVGVEFAVDHRPLTSSDNPCWSLPPPFTSGARVELPESFLAKLYLLFFTFPECINQPFVIASANRSGDS
ncbi:hypothetical protein B0H10DRAFT_2222391 [Mycena sp. CBHHK59/15]|nr:hypothetical protein B0H10DRAFT_2243851 [Mycena sp. CBHHK59/15]KAJ6613199.1 hypothetical protein B0H10DRAFT_2222391 [Mycena sp. CBHHK59/15]